MKFSLIGLLLLTMTLSSFGADRNALWKQVDEAVQKGLPRTAITNLEPIIDGALAERDFPEAVKAIGRKVALEGTIEGNKPEERIPRLERYIAQAPPEMVPIMETLLAHWYWDYFQRNRWRFMQRTTTAAEPGQDFTTWDLPRLFSEIDRHFQKALSAQAVLKKTPIEAWDELLEQGTTPDAYRPTLYDFIAFEALDFYRSGEQAAAKPQDAFVLEASSPIFETAEKFMEWDAGPAFTPEASPVLNAIALFQRLLRFHQSDAAPNLAFAHVDLQRIVWGYNASSGEAKEERFPAALRDYIRKHAEHEISAIARHDLAQFLRRQGKVAEARAEAAQGVKAFPDSPGGNLCKNLVAEIEAKSATIRTERVWNAPWPDIQVTYRNVDRVYFRAVAYDWELFLDQRRNRPENLNVNERREVLQRTPTLEWSSNLPQTTDYQETSYSVAAPGGLKPGFYFILASHDASFSENDNIISMCDVWVSDLALVTRSNDGKIEGFVLEANSGQPLAGAEVAAWFLNNQGIRVPLTPKRTDANGYFWFVPDQHRGYLLRARHNGRELASAYETAAHQRHDPPPRGQSVLFTDRAIYRPGQTVQYKGIALWVDTAGDNYRVLRNEPVTVIFSDVNGKEIARSSHRANDYGSFSGSFTAPRDTLMGHMTLRVEGLAQGAASIRVEEYKRPKFKVTVEAPVSAPKLNETVTLKGSAMSYTGAAVDGADVSYRVVREVRMPWWWGWGWRRPSFGERQEIAHGTVKTGVDGSFSIEFKAQPDLSVPEKDEPVFVFRVQADVTDNAGETRSGEEEIRIGYTALEAKLEASDWQTDAQLVEIKVRTSTLNGEPQSAEGILRIHELEAPSSVQRPPLTEVYPVYRRGLWNVSGEEEDKDLSDPRNWPLGRIFSEKQFRTETNGEAVVSFSLPAGVFRAVLETRDRFGKEVTGKLPVQVFRLDATDYEVPIPQRVAVERDEYQPGEELVAIWGTGYESGRAFVEIEHRNQMIQRYWTDPRRTQQLIRVPIEESMRGGFTLHITQVRENRAYLKKIPISVPWKNKDLVLKWEHFVSKLQPGQKKTWTVEIRAPRSTTNSLEQNIAEMVATLYDESLDAFAPHNWIQRFQVFRQEHSDLQARFENQSRQFNRIFGRWSRDMENVTLSYRSFPDYLRQDHRVFFRNRFGLGLGGGGEPAAPTVALSSAVARPESVQFSLTPKAFAEERFDSVALAGEAGTAPQTGPVLDQVTARKNLNETAFFYPQLLSDTNGVVRITFTMPEALTRWHFFGFAHDRQLRSGLLEGHTVTAKDLMVQPNPPRFLREGDTVEFTVKVSNQSDRSQTGKVRLAFADWQSEESADQSLGNDHPEQQFEIPAKESRSYSWRITIPDGCGFLTYKAVGATETVSDGEEGAIPVLSRRILVTESLPLPIRGPGTNNFEFGKLLNSSDSETLQHQSLTVQMVSNPAWYAVLALPYLMEFPHECTEQVFNRLYANALARSIANKNPRIRRVFDQWKNTPALDSPLEKNQELKAVSLEETPWLRQALNESQARRNVGILFDENRLNNEQESNLRKLAEMQLHDGSWPWFPGGRANDYITLYITTGFGRLRHLGVEIDTGPAQRSLGRLDNWIQERYARIQERDNPEDYVPGAIDALYLYGRSFFLKDRAIAAGHQQAIDFFLNQARKLWVKTGNRQAQAHIALALKRFNADNSANHSTSMDIMKSLKERSVSNEEMGMFWRDTERSWWWYHAPIESQALMIEAFDEVANDEQAVEDCGVWLLKQKQTQDWKTTKATADAVYALLLRGADLLASDALVEIQVGGLDLTPKNAKLTSPALSRTAVEPGTGFYEVRFQRGEIKPAMGEVTVRKTNAGVAWGSLHWQYLEDMAKVTPHEGTPLKLNKALFRKVNTERGPVLEKLGDDLSVGDELVVRIELRTDRDMEYVHMKDQRGSGTEPVNVLSQYRYQDGLAYYESTRDTASHFFIDYLPKGTYVFEYSTRVQLRGEYQTGVTHIECMYAPEFNSHSESIPLLVR